MTSGLVFVLVSALAQAPSPSQTPKAVVARAEPLLRAQCQNVREGWQPGTEAYGRFGALFDRLLKDQGQVADETVVVLLWYYIGEGPGEDLAENISARGKRELPYLLKYRRHPPGGIRLPEPCREHHVLDLDPKVVDGHFSELAKEVVKQ